jgi:hypothetical protein
MSNLGQDIVVSFIEHTWKFVKGESERRSVAAMQPGELAAWKEQELAKLHREAVRMAGLSSDRELAKRGQTRADSTRVYEAILRDQRGVEMGQFLLEGMDLRGLDLSRVRKGSLHQAHVDRAAGDAATKLPPGLTAPAVWG